MNPQFPTDPRQALEVSLTALLLGELPPDQAEFLQKAIAQDQELAKKHERLKQTIGLVRETEHKPVKQPAPLPEPLRLAEERRQRLLQHFKTVTPTEFVEESPGRFSWRVPSWLVPVGVAAALLIVVGGALLPALSRAKFKLMHSAQYAETEAASAPRDLLNAKSAHPAEETLTPLSITPLPAASVEAPKTTIVLPSAAPEAPPPAIPSANSYVGGQNAGDLSLGFGLPAGGGIANAPAPPPPTAAQTTSSTSDSGGLAGGTPQSNMRLRDLGRADATVEDLSRDRLQESLRNSGDAAKAEGLPALPLVNVAGGGYSGGGGGLGGGLPTPMRPAQSSPAPAQNLADSTSVAGGIFVPPAQSASAGREPQAVQELAKSFDRYGLARSGGNTEAKAPEGGFPRTESVPAIDPTTGLPVPLGEVNGVVTAIDPATGLPMGAEKKDAKWQLSQIPDQLRNSHQAGQTFAFGLGGAPNAYGLSQNSESAARTGAINPATGLPEPPLLDPNTGLPLVAGKEVRSYGGRAVGDELGRAPILGDKPAIGRMYQTNAAVDFIAQSDAQHLPQLGVNFDPAEKRSSIVLPQSQLDAGWALPRKSAQDGGSLGISTNYIAAFPEAAPATPLAWAGSGEKDESKLLHPLVQDGKLLLEMGRADEAKAKLREAVKEDPQNQSAYYYLNRANEEQYKKAENRRQVESREKLVNTEKALVEPAKRQLLPEPRLYARSPALESAETKSPADAQLGQMPDSKDTVRAYADAKRQLEELNRQRMQLYMRMESESTDLKLPKTGSVEITDLAAATPSEPPTLGARIRRAFGGEVERKARVKIDRDANQLAGSYSPYFVQTENEVIQSDAVLGKVVDDLKLDQEWAKKAAKGEKLSKAEAVQRLKGMLNLKSVPNSGLLDIGVKSEQPEEAAKLANTIAQEYQNYRDEEGRRLRSGGIDALTNRLSDVEAKVQEAQKQVSDLGGKLHIEQFAEGQNPLYTAEAESAPRLKELRAQTQAEIARQTALLQQTKNLTLDQLAATLPTNGVQDALLRAYLEEMTFLEQKLTDTGSKQSGPASPETFRVRSRLDEVKRKSAERAQSFVAATQARVASMQQSIDLLDAKLAKTERDEAPTRPAPRGLEPQPEIDTRENAFSTFSLNVSDVSFKLAAASLEKGALPDPASIRSEEFINAFDYRDPEAPPGVPVAFAWDRARYPFAQNRDLLRFSIKTAAQGRQTGQPLNLVLLLDNSGSMERADRVQIIREALRVLSSQLQPQDKLSVITFARTAQLRFDGVPGNQGGQVAEEVSVLTPQGGTNLEEAMNLAYQTALKHYLAGGINRVVLLTDGAANLGDVGPENLKKKVEDHRKQGIALDCFGIGWEGYNDDLLEILSRNGDGRYGFINTPEEASTEFAAQLAGALHVAASDVKVQVEFNPKRVTAWRQIGYAKHQLTKEQFRDNTVDAAEIGAAEAGNALYTVEVNPRGEGDLGTVRVRYKIPGTTDYREHEWPVPYNGTAAPLEQSSPAMRLAASASAFSEWLATSPFAAEVTPDALLSYLSGVPEIYGADARPKKLEWMIRQAKSLTGK